MGVWSSRQEGDAQELDSEAILSYKYPPKSGGRFFGSHFIMGGEKFETLQPEAYLFGDTSDLNFLGGRPAQCAYALAAPGEPSRTLKSVVHVRRDSLRLVRQPAADGSRAETPATQRLSVEFTLDTDVRCDVSVHYFCSEEITRAGPVYRSRQPALSSETVRFGPGAAQVFHQPQHTIRPSRHTDQELSFSADTELYPVVVLCRTVEGDQPRQTHVTTGSIEKSADGGYTLKPLKQKQCMDGLVFLLQEIYGIENKVAESRSDDEAEDSGAECVICMSELRDTLILPCRHLCVCSGCADHLRYQASNCPICRAPFRALLHLRAVQPTVEAQPPTPPPTSGAPPPAGGIVPPGYTAVSMVEALNGPLVNRPPRSPTTRSVHRAPSTNSADIPSQNTAGSARRRGLDGGRSRTPSREKSTPGSEAEQAERRSLLESATAAANDTTSDASDHEPDVASVSGEEHNSRLVTVIPIEHASEPHRDGPQRDPEEDSIEELCRPQRRPSQSQLPPPPLEVDVADRAGCIIIQGTTEQAEVV